MGQHQAVGCFGPGSRLSLPDCGSGTHLQNTAQNCGDSREHVAVPGVHCCGPGSLEIASRGKHKVLFLDVDGVLHPAGGPEVFAANCVHQLQRIVRETGAEVVLSTSWRVVPDYKDALVAHMGKWGLDRPIDSTPVSPPSMQSKPPSASVRAVEIVSWLNSNSHHVDFPRWVAIDDLDMSTQLDPHMVVTDKNVGLTVQHAEVAIRKLNSETVCECIQCRLAAETVDFDVAQEAAEDSYRD